MSEKLEQLQARLNNKLGGKIEELKSQFGEITIKVSPADLLAVSDVLRNDPDFYFQQLTDLTGIDYLDYGKGEWVTDEAANSGFSRGVQADTAGRLKFGELLEETRQGPRFAVAYQLMSYKHNVRLRMKVFAADAHMPRLDSVTPIWDAANWYEREAFDLFGILFEGHPDLRRILTDYGFVGHPFRKDFPLVGNVEMRYDPEQRRVIYEPVSIEPRVLVPRVVRNDSRYADRVED